jgi:sortase A
VARTASRIGTALCIAGIAVLAWGAVTWKWGDPLTGLYTRRAQSALAGELERRARSFGARRPELATILRPAAPEASLRRAARTLAAAYRRDLREGDAVGRLRVPRLGLNAVIVFGTTTGSLRRGPGLEQHTFLPGQGKLIYVAGHRTTYLAPFAHIDSLRVGDQATVEMPYGTFVYRVRSSRIVAADDLSVLRSGGSEVLRLQACHPRFRATHRYIVSAPLVRVERASLRR